MKFTKVKNAVGTETIVVDTVKNSAGTAIGVKDDVLDSDGNPFVVFTDTLTGVIPRVTFVATSNRVFVA